MTLCELNAASSNGAPQPAFDPIGLKVLLVEAQCDARERTARQLRELDYNVTPCCSCKEAAGVLEGGQRVDVLLVEANLVADGSAATAHFLAAAQSQPLVLMSDHGSTTEVMLGIQLGAVDFLERPLSDLKLRNIWQHVVRKMLSNGKTSSSHSQGCKSSSQCKEASSPASPLTPAASGDDAVSVTSNNSNSKPSEGMSSSTSEHEHSMEAGSCHPKASVDSAKACDATTFVPVPACEPSKLGRGKVGSVSLAHRAPLAAAKPAAAAAAASYVPANPLVQPPQPQEQALQASAMPAWSMGRALPVNPPGCVWGTPVLAPMPPTMPAVGPAFWPSYQGGPSLMQQPSPPLVPMVPTPGMDSQQQAVPAMLTAGLHFALGDKAGAAAQKPPIGLSLRKSASFVDLINQHLSGAAAC